MSEDNSKNPEDERDPSSEGDKTEETEDSSNQSDKSLNDGVLIAIGFIVLLVFVGGLYAVSTTTNTGTTTQPASTFAYDEFEGLEQSGVTNSSVVVNSHAEALSERSYTITSETISGNQSADVSYRYNNETQEGLTVQSVENGARNEAYENFTTRQRFIAQSVNSDNTSYERTFVTAATPYSGDAQVFEFLTTTNKEATGVVTGEDGEDVVIYEIQSVKENFTDQFNIEGEIRFSENGYFTLADVTVEILGQNGNVTTTTEQTLRIEDIGDTTVDEPNWIDSARAETEPAQPPEPPENVTVQPEGGSNGEATDTNTTDENTSDANTTDG
jgi:hypothetical protein